MGGAFDKEMSNNNQEHFIQANKYTESKVSQMNPTKQISYIYTAQDKDA